MAYPTPQRLARRASLVYETLDLRCLLTAQVWPGSFSAWPPQGGAAYGSVVRDLLAPQQVAEYRLALDAGQTLRVKVDPTPELSPAVRVLSAAGDELAAASSREAGSTIWTPPMAVAEAGEYRIEVRDLGGLAGHFAITASLQGAWEEESLGSGNNGGMTLAQTVAWLPNTVGPPPSDAALLAYATLQGELEPQPLHRESFEEGVLGSAWNLSTSSGGRIQVTDRAGAEHGEMALLMDSTSTTRQSSQVTRSFSWDPQRETFLQFAHTDFRDTLDRLPATFSLSAVGDGVAISQDGFRWFTVFTPTSASLDGAWQQVSINLLEAIQKAGWQPTSQIQVRLQQAGRQAFPNGGRAYDEVRLVESQPSDEDWFTWRLAAGESLSVALASPDPRTSFEVISEAGQLIALPSQHEGMPSVLHVTATEPESFFVRVHGPESTYQLFSASNAQLEQEPNDLRSAAGDQLNSGTWRLGTLASQRPIPFDQLQFNGSAKLVRAADGSDRVRLTEETPLQAGTVFAKTPLELTPGKSFSSHFSVEMLSTGGISDVDGLGGHGISFVLQRDPRGATALGTNSVGMGVFGITPFVSVELDTWHTGEWDGDINFGINGNHVAINTSGRPLSLAQTAPLPRFNDGGLRYVWVDYTGATQQMSVFLSDHPTKPDSPVLSAVVDFAQLFGDDLTLYAGFAASTGNAITRHELVNWNVTLDQADYFRLDAQAGDHLDIRLQIPASGPAEFNNSLSADLKIWDPQGILWQQGNAGQQSSSLLDLVALQSGTYVVGVVGGSAGGAGEYQLYAQGGTSQAPHLSVIETVPRLNEPTKSTVDRLIISFDQALRRDTVAASDVIVAGESATNVTFVDDRTLQVSFPTLGNGSHLISIPAGAITALSGAKNPILEGELRIDTVVPYLENISVEAGGTLPAQTPWELVLTFSEPVDIDAIPLNALRLQYESGITVKAEALRANPASDQLTIRFPELIEGSYQFMLESSWVKDLAGNILDGERLLLPTADRISGDGVAGGDFVWPLMADVGVEVLDEDWQRVSPLGSLGFSHHVSGVIQSASDVDQFIIRLDQPQTIGWTFRGIPLHGNLQVVAPNGDVLAELPTAGRGAAFDWSPQQAWGPGEYRITVSGVDGSQGAYTLDTFVGMAFEAEQRGEGLNNSRETAQPLDHGWLTIDDTDAARVMISGTLNRFTEDFESGALSSQWTVRSSHPAGRVRVGTGFGASQGDFAILMDSDSVQSELIVNEAIWNVDLTDIAHPILKFAHADFADSQHVLPQVFEGTGQGDGVSISSDGQRWYTILNATNVPGGQWREESIDLRAAAAAAQLTLGRDLKIKFQQADRRSLPQDGRAYDNIRIVQPDEPAVQDIDWYRLTLEVGESLTAAVLPILPVAMSLDLYDAGGQWLARSQAADNLGSVISAFYAPSNMSSDYFLRVSAEQGVVYRLLATRNVGFDHEPNALIGNAQATHGQLKFLGHVHSAEFAPDVSAEGGLQLLQSFAGSDSDCCIPPDPTLAVGPEQIVTLVNSEFAIYDKITGSPLFRQHMRGPTGFFGEVGATEVVFDPWVLFDDDSQRFFAIGIDSLESTNQSFLYVAVSRSATPRSGSDWFKYRLDFTDRPDGSGLGTDAHFADYPKLGVNNHAIWLSGNYFPITTGSGVYSGVTAFDKQMLVSGGGLSVVYQERLAGFSLFPLQSYGDAPVEYFAESTLNGGGAIRIHAIRRENGVYQREVTSVTVPSYRDPINVPQLDLLETLDGIDARIMSGVWRNGSAWFAHAIQDPLQSVGRNVVRWYEVQTGPFTGSLSPLLRQSGNVDAGPGVHAWMPGISVDARGNMALGFSVAGLQRATGIGYTGRLANDPLGTTMTPQTLIEGASYASFRWGDYSGLAIDPADNSTFWIFHEYAQDDGTWSTQIGAFRVQSPSDEDWYDFAFDAGQSVDIALAAPQNAWLVSDLIASWEVYSPSGQRLLSAQGTLDQLQAPQTLHVNESGSYRLRIVAQNSTGEYQLSVSANQRQRPHVVSSTPAAGAILAAWPESVQLVFSEELRIDSVDLLDLMPSAQGVRQIAPRTWEWRLAADANGGHGQYGMLVAADQLLDLQGQGNDPYLLDFQVDLLPPRVIGTQWNGMPPNQPLVLPAGDLALSVLFNEPLNQASSARRGLLIPGRDDISLRDNSGTIYRPRSVALAEQGQRLDAMFIGLPEGSYRLTLVSGPNAFEDVVGNDLDGEATGRGADGTPSGDGTAGGDYVIDLLIDNAVAPIQRFERLLPAGNLVYVSRNNTGLLDASDDIDRFVWTIEAGQSLSARAMPTDPEAILEMWVEFVDNPTPASSRTIYRGQPGKPVILPALGITTSGAMQIALRSDRPTEYRLEIYRNASLEQETADLNGQAIAIDWERHQIDVAAGWESMIGTSRPITEQFSELVWAVLPADRRIALLDPRTQRIIRSFPTPDAIQPHHRHVGLDLDRDGSLLYFNSDIDRTRLYRLHAVTGTIVAIEPLPASGQTDYSGMATVVEPPVRTTLYAADMSTNPQWNLQGSWAYGTPTGRGGDPTSGFTGTSVIGYNLDGTYRDLMPVEYATMPPISTVGYKDVRLNFARWLGVEEAFYDGATIDASVDGQQWTTVWSTLTTIQDESWLAQTIDLSDYDDVPSLHLRWSMGPSDDSFTFSGWNIDDVTVTGIGNAKKDRFVVSAERGIDRLDGPDQVSNVWSPLSGVALGGLAGDGTSRLFANFADGYLREIDWQHPGVAVRSFPAPAADIEGLAFDGQRLYASTAVGDLFVLDPDTGTVLQQWSGFGQAVVGLAAQRPTGKTNLLLNGDFESGTFEHWHAVTNGLLELSPWQIVRASSGALGTTNPIQGEYSASNGFDGEAGLIYELYQDVQVPADQNPTLVTNHRIVFDSFGITSRESRRLTLSIRDLNNQVLETLFTQTVNVSEAFYTDLGWDGREFDLSRYRGQSIRVHFEEFVPESFAGPGQIEFDDLQLNVDRQLTIIHPDIDRYSLDLTDGVGQSLDISLTGMNSDMSGQQLVLLNPNGTVVARGQRDAQSGRLGSHSLAILNYVITTGGTYTLQFSSEVAGEYVLTTSFDAVLEIEPFPPRPNAVRDIAHASGAVGFVGNAAGWLLGTFDSGSFSTLNLENGEAFSLGAFASLPIEMEYLGSRDRAFVIYDQTPPTGQMVDVTSGKPLSPLIPLDADFTALEWVAGRLLGGVRRADGGSELRWLDPQTGQSQWIGNTGVGPLNGLAYSPVEERLYAIGQDAGASALFGIDWLTGSATAVGRLTIDADGMAWGPDDRLYVGGAGLSAGGLYTLDPNTAQLTRIGFSGTRAYTSLLVGPALAVVGSGSSSVWWRKLEQPNAAPYDWDRLAGLAAYPQTLATGTTSMKVVEPDTAGDFYSLDLQAGERVRITVHALWSNPQADGYNSLDPFAVVVDDQGDYVTFDEDGGPGNDVQIEFVAAVRGRFFVMIGAERGFGEYEMTVQRSLEMLPIAEVSLNVNPEINFLPSVAVSVDGASNQGDSPPTWEVASAGEGPRVAGRRTSGRRDTWFADKLRSQTVAPDHETAFAATDDWWN